jgi:hypothetical protein
MASDEHWPWSSAPQAVPVAWLAYWQPRVMLQVPVVQSVSGQSSLVVQTVQAPLPSQVPSLVPAKSQAVPADSLAMPQVMTPLSSEQVTDSHCGLLGAVQEAGGSSGAAQGSKSSHSSSQNSLLAFGEPGGSHSSGGSTTLLPQTPPAPSRPPTQ